MRGMEDTAPTWKRPDARGSSQPWIFTSALIHGSCDSESTPRRANGVRLYAEMCLLKSGL
jgi:hypothetical protein